MTAALIDDVVLDDVALDDVALDDVALDDVVLTAPPAPRLTLAPPPALHAAAQPTRIAKLRNFEPPSDPMADVAGHVLSIPLRHMYAVLLRVGVIEVKA